MAFRIEEFVERGEIDNRVRDQVTGRIWLHGRADPVTLDLRGNLLRDLAGCRLEFRNPRPAPGRHTDTLAAEQCGTVGDMTASRKASVFVEPVETAWERMEAGEPVARRQVNVLYLEWFSETNGRVVIEAPDYELSVSSPVWNMTPGEEAGQAEENRLAFRGWMQQVDEARAEEADGEESSAAYEGPLDEFEWEKRLKQSDACGERYGEVMEKYRGRPDEDRLIAREMGWDRLDELLEADARGVFKEEKEQESIDELYEEAEAFRNDFVPDPEKEGETWVRDDRGELRHPLAWRGSRFTLATHREMERLGLLADPVSPEAIDFWSNVSGCAGKLAGGLNSLVYDDEPFEPGMTIAWVKRALKFLTTAIAGFEKLSAGDRLPPALKAEWRAELFGLREDILHQIADLRRQLP